MPVPKTRGSLRYHILEMEVGDYFPMQVGEGTGSGGSGSDYYLYPMDWEAWGKNVWKQELNWKKGTNNNIADGVFYFIKVDDGLLIADRVIRTNISQHELKYGVNNYIEGKLMTIDGVEGIMRAIDGGLAWNDGSGKPVYTTPKNDFGAFPTDNEYDKYIVKSNLGGNVTPNDEDVWHHSYFESITRYVNPKNSSECIQRGGAGSGTTFVYRGSTYNSASYDSGFRPVFDYGYKYR